MTRNPQSETRSDAPRRVNAVAQQGYRHHFRLKAIGGVWDCRTQEMIDDGCSMLGTCLKCEPVCAPGTEPAGAVAHRCGTDP